MTIFQIEGKLYTTKNLIITQLTWSFCKMYKYEERATLLMIKLVLEIPKAWVVGQPKFERIHMVWKERMMGGSYIPTAPFIIANRHVGKGRKRRGSSKNSPPY